MKEHESRVNELNEAQVDILHVASQAKNAADDKLKAVMTRFAENHTAPAVVVLISSQFSLY